MGRALDLFSGAGALGIEALSRGFDRAVFVDNDRTALRLIRKNLSLCRAENLARVLDREAAHFLKKLDSDAPFSLVLLDPPYHKGLALPALELLGRPGWLDEDGVVVCETEVDVALPDRVGGFSLNKHKIYGDTAVWLYIHEK